MCLIAFAWRVHPRFPLVVAANRDEFHARPSHALELWGEDPDVMGGRDLHAGGSWMGVRRGGRFAAVTNVRTPDMRPAPHSRGALVSHFLLEPGAAASTAEHVVCAAGQYGGFNLLLGDGEELVWATNHPVPVWHGVEPGVHGVSNGAPSFADAASWPKVCRLVADLSRWLDKIPRKAPKDGPQLEIETLFKHLSNEHAVPDSQLPDTGVGITTERRLAPIFVRGEQYGTRCSSVLLVGADGTMLMRERRFKPNGVFAGETEMGLPPP